MRLCLAAGLNSYVIGKIVDREAKQVEKDIEQIRSMIDTFSQRYQGKRGDVRFAGIEGGTIKVAPTGFCWR